MEAVFWLMRTMVPMRSPRCWSVKLTVSPTRKSASCARGGGGGEACGGFCAAVLDEHGGVRQDPVAGAGGVLDYGLGLTQLEDAPLAHRLGEIVGDVAHSHTDMQVLADLEDTLGVVDHPPDGQVRLLSTRSGAARC